VNSNEKTVTKILNMPLLMVQHCSGINSSRMTFNYRN